MRDDNSGARLDAAVAAARRENSGRFGRVNTSETRIIGLFAILLSLAVTIQSCYLDRNYLPRVEAETRFGRIERVAEVQASHLAEINRRLGRVEAEQTEQRKTLEGIARDLATISARLGVRKERR